MAKKAAAGQAFTGLKKAGLVIGFSLLLAAYVLPAPEGMSLAAWHTAGIGLLLAVFWATEALPIPVTSLLPLLLFPAFEIMPMAESAAPYARPTIFLLLGGFIIATCMARWNLHRRIALHILLRSGDHPAGLVGGFMAATALLSMWISNTATTIMMIPIALSLAGEIIHDKSKKHANGVLCLLLGIAYAASIGGLGTIIGTPPNLFVVGFMKSNYGVEIGFLDWMMFGIPAVIVMTFAAWAVLTKWAYPFDLGDTPMARHIIQEALDDMGPLTMPEKRLAAVLLLVALSWVFRVPVQEHLGLFPWLNDAMIAVGGAVAMFLVPSGSDVKKGAALLDWETASKIPWGVLLLFGGGLSLAAAVKSSDLAVWLGMNLSSLTTLHLVFMLLGVISLVIFLTELTSNTATTATLLPILGAMATAGNIDPMLLFAPTALAASCAFMLPVATAPNAVVYSTGKVTIAEMAMAGFRLNLIGIALLTPLCYVLIPLVF